MLKLYTVLHPMQADNPWNSGPGWRWAIHTDTRFDQVAEGCLNAMQFESQGDAQMTLDMVVMTLRRGFVVAGVEAEIVAEIRTDCPLNTALVDELAQLV